MSYVHMYRVGQGLHHLDQSLIFIEELFKMASHKELWCTNIWTISFGVSPDNSLHQYMTQSW